jgi:hypothetical protein
MNTPIYLDIEESASRLNNITFVDKKFLSTIVLTNSVDKFLFDRTNFAMAGQVC